MPHGQHVAMPVGAAAKAVIAAARQREAELAVRVQGSEDERREAVAVRGRLAARLAAGEDVAADALGPATAAIAAAEEKTALLQDALREAEAVTKRAEEELVGLLRAEMGRRLSLVRAAAHAAERRRAQAQVELGDLEALATDLRLAVNDRTQRAADLETVLARADDVATAVEAA